MKKFIHFVAKELTMPVKKKVVAVKKKVVAVKKKPVSKVDSRLDAVEADIKTIAHLLNLHKEWVFRIYKMFKFAFALNVLPRAEKIESEDPALNGKYKLVFSIKYLENGADLPSEKTEDIYSTEEEAIKKAEEVIASLELVQSIADNCVYLVGEKIPPAK